MPQYLLVGTGLRESSGTTQPKDWRLAPDITLCWYRHTRHGVWAGLLSVCIRRPQLPSKHLRGVLEASTPRLPFCPDDFSRGLWTDILGVWEAGGGAIYRTFWEFAAICMPRLL